MIYGKLFYYLIDHGLYTKGIGEIADFLPQKT
jgi:hypothetical protein